MSAGGAISRPDQTNVFIVSDCFNVAAERLGQLSAFEGVSHFCDRSSKYYILHLYQLQGVGLLYVKGHLIFGQSHTASSWRRRFRQFFGFDRSVVLYCADPAGKSGCGDQSCRKAGLVDSDTTCPVRHIDNYPDRSCCAGSPSWQRPMDVLGLVERRCPFPDPDNAPSTI